jgi:hypothetical protein
MPLCLAALSSAGGPAQLSVNGTTARASTQAQRGADRVGAGDGSRESHRRRHLPRHTRRWTRPAQRTVGQQQQQAAVAHKRRPGHGAGRGPSAGRDSLGSAGGSLAPCASASLQAASNSASRRSGCHSAAPSSCPLTAPPSLPPVAFRFLPDSDSPAAALPAPPLAEVAAASPSPASFVSMTSPEADARCCWAALSLSACGGRGSSQAGIRWSERNDVVEIRVSERVSKRALDLV